MRGRCGGAEAWSLASIGRWWWRVGVGVRGGQWMPGFERCCADVCKQCDAFC